MRTKYILLIVLGSIILGIYSCEIDKPEIPIGDGNKTFMEDPVIQDSGYRAATVLTYIYLCGNHKITEHGHCWNTSPEPDITLGTKTRLGIYTPDQEGAFRSEIKNLQPDTKYYVRAYIEFEDIVVYSAQNSFMTLPLGVPIVTTAPVTQITSTSAQSGGEVISEGGSPVIVRGIYCSLSSSITLSDDHTENGAGLGVFSSTLTGLAPNQTYYVRAYATNENGTALGNLVEFTTNPSLVSKKILYIGDDTILGELGTCDAEMVDSLVSWGSEVTYTGDNNYDAMGTGSGIHDNYDGIFFGESCSSAYATPYGEYGDNFPIPAIVLEPAVFIYNDIQKWNLLTDQGGIVAFNFNDIKNVQVKIVDNTHYITSGFNMNEIVTWSNSTDYYNVSLGYVYGFKYNVDVLAMPVAPVEPSYAMAMCVINDVSFHQKIFFWTNTHSLLNNYQGTVEFYQIIKRAAEFIYGSAR